MHSAASLGRVHGLRSMRAPRSLTKTHSYLEDGLQVTHGEHKVRLGEHSQTGNGEGQNPVDESGGAGKRRGGVRDACVPTRAAVGVPVAGTLRSQAVRSACATSSRVAQETARTRKVCYEKLESEIAGYIRTLSGNISSKEHAFPRLPFASAEHVPPDNVAVTDILICGVLLGVGQVLCGIGVDLDLALLDARRLVPLWGAVRVAVVHGEHLVVVAFSLKRKGVTLEGFLYSRGMGGVGIYGRV